MGGRSSLSGKGDLASHNTRVADLDPQDIYNPKGYFSGTDQLVNTSFSKWVKDADNGFGDLGRDFWSGTVNDYMEDSSINDELLTKGYWDLSYSDQMMVVDLDNWINHSKLSQDTILYSGLSSSKISAFKGKSSLYTPSYTSTSPDPVYAFGYTAGQGSNPTMLKIHAKKGTNIGKTYYEGTAGTEGVLARGSNFKVIKRTKGKVQGNDVDIIEVELV